MILVHLMKMNRAVLRVVEQPSADGSQFDGGVRQLPLAVRRRVDFAAQGTAQDLMAETDATEADVGPFLPKNCGRVSLVVQSTRLVWRASKTWLKNTVNHLLLCGDFIGGNLFRRTLNQLDQFQNPWSVIMCIIHAPCDQNSVHIIHLFR